MVKRKNIKTKKISSLSVDICDLKTVDEKPLRFKPFGMKIITAEKNNIIYFGNVEKIAEKIDMPVKEIEEWIDQGKGIVYKNGFKVNLNIEEL